MEFQKGLNVIIGSNNSGKTGLLYAINMLNSPSITSAHDFNKNVIAKFATAFQDDAPKIIFEFEIRHKISEDDTEDESIIKLAPFLGMEAIESAREEDDASEGDEEEEDDDDEGAEGAEGDGESRNAIYDIVATVTMTFALDTKAIGDYKRDVKGAKSLDDFVSLVDAYLPRYIWSFTNGASDTEAEKRDAVNIFDIRFIGAERTSSDVAKETKREIDSFAKEQNNVAEIQKLKQSLSDEIKELLEPALSKMSALFENENNEIGLNGGNVSIFQNIRPDVRIADAYVTDVKDTKGDFVVPLENNGLGYNNLINIYMLIKLNEIRRGKDFRVLCLEEPEAHLHPAMQYKLFKFLKTLDETDKLNQQIFVTTHSSNISAVAGIDNMYMLDYCRTVKAQDCFQQSLEAHFRDKADAKKHLTKFLDVTRSDMLFADKVILVEGIAEKMLLPSFMEKCGCAYEDGNISIVEIGGKHFEHFIELFNGNAVHKKVLCITDRDFKWIKEEGGTRTLSDYGTYGSSDTPHIAKLTDRFRIDNLSITTQSGGGRTFEDELFLVNLIADEADSGTKAESLMKIIANDTVSRLVENYKFDFDLWDKNRPTASNSIVSMYLDIFKAAMVSDAKNTDIYKKLFFAELFLYYASSGKGDVALDILTDEKLCKSLVVPAYIKEGLEWLSK
jgi:predicted ATP-dependent endonuclease of OLD family